jgi:hypothetical protein
VCSELVWERFSSRKSSQDRWPLTGRNHPLHGRFEQSEGFRELEEVALVDHSAGPSQGAQRPRSHTVFLAASANRSGRLASKM